MSVWEQLDVEAAVLEALGADQAVSPDQHHFGRPYLRAYQLAIKVDAAHPEIRAALRMEVGGKGTGAQSSLSQYLALQLSQRIKSQGERYPVQGAFISNDHLKALNYRGQDGKVIESSLTGSGFDLSLFRARP